MRALVALLAGAAVLLAGCAAADPEDTETSAPSGTSLLTFAVYGPPPVVTAYAKIAADYSRDHPDTVVNVRPYDSVEAAASALRKDVETGSTPDVFLTPVEELPWLMDEDAISPVDEPLIEREVDFGDDYQRNALEAFSFDKLLQCMPVDVSPLVAYYNTDLVDLDDLRDPDQEPVDPVEGWTLEEFAEAARRASGGGVQGVYVAPTLEQLAPFLWSDGGELVDDDQEPTTLRLSDGSSRSGLAKVLAVLRNPQVTFTQLQIARRSALDRFKNGSLGIVLGYRSLTPQLRAVEDLPFDVMPLPQLGGRATVGESNGLCLGAAGESASKAADFLAYAVSDPASTLLAKTGYTVPTNLAVLNSPDFLQPERQPDSPSVFALNVRYVRMLPTVDAWHEVEAAAAPLLTRLFYDPVIDPLDERLREIDDLSVPLFTPGATPAP